MVSIEMKSLKSRLRHVGLGFVHMINGKFRPLIVVDIDSRKNSELIIRHLEGSLSFLKFSPNGLFFLNTENRKNRVQQKTVNAGIPRGFVTILGNGYSIEWLTY